MDEADTKAERKELRRERILDAAESVFTEKDYYVATVEEIAERASIQKGTVYLYFESKLDLFLSMLERRLVQVRAMLEATVEAAPDPLEAIRRLLRAELDFYYANFDSFKTVNTRVTSFMDGRGPECEVACERLIPLFVSMSEVWANCIREGQRMGIFQDIDALPTASTFRAAIRSCVLIHHFEPGSSAAKSAAFLERLFLEGLLRRSNQRETDSAKLD